MYFHFVLQENTYQKLFNEYENFQFFQFCMKTRIKN
jgi:hypothetical protein